MAKATKKAAKKAAAKGASGAKSSTKKTVKKSTKPVATKASAKRPAQSKGKGAGEVTLLVGTKKGAFTLKSKGNRTEFSVSEPTQFGHIVHHVVSDPRNPKDLVMATKTGHLGPTVKFSHDGGKTWTESTKPPAFPKAPEGEKGQAVKAVFWVTPSNAKEPGVWYAGTAPMGLWRSDDRGETWSAVEGFNSHKRMAEWAQSGGVPDDFQTILHSINVDPNDPKRLYFGVSSGGVFESTDGGKDWVCINKGCAADFMPEPDPEFGHDVHCMAQHPVKTDRLYQQNHCGLYRMERAKGVWERIGNNMPKEIGDSGFVVGLHPRDPDTIWTFPMETSDVWPRVSKGGKPAVYKSTDAGASFKRCDKGFPKANAYFQVKRQCMAVDNHGSVGVYIGTSHGEVWASNDEGNSWRCVAQHLPPIISVEVVH